MRHPAFEGSITVDDSKKIFSPATGLELLNRGVGRFLECIESNESTPQTAPGLERLLPPEDCANLEEDSWGRMGLTAFPNNTNGIPRRRVKILAKNPGHSVIPALREALLKNKIEVLGLGARALSAKHYNLALRAGNNKADVNWNVIAAQFKRLIKLARPGECIHACIDRQGGRKFYSGQICELFSGAMPWVEVETQHASMYRIEVDGRIVRIVFLVNADGHTLLAALASMAAKLARELCMQRINAFFNSHAPENTLRPTAGYFSDARRFLRETRGIRKKLGIANRDLVRLK